jgi:ATP-dependent DNA helicase RecQ
MKVLIVAKTRQGSGACIGAITFEGQSVRLIAADAEWNEKAGMEYEVGEVWELEAAPAKKVIPPHVENVIVRSKRRLPPLNGKNQFIRRHMPPVRGGPGVLYEGLTQATKMGGMYIAEESGVPSHSTTFWIPDQPLARVDDGKRIHYRYPDPAGGRRLTYVGFQEPPETIPAGALLRVSLAHWWRPQDKPDHELRCYVQLSGWFMEDEIGYAEFGNPVLYGSPVESGTVPAVAAAATRRPAREIPLNMDQAQQLLEQVFGYDSFWPLQGDVIANLLKGRDTLAIMPTGSGKSLCYQLPALMFGGLTVVVSPLISLMQDQVDQLRELEVPAVYLNSTLSHPEYVVTADRVRGGQVKLLYLAPETLLRPETLVMLDNSNVDCLAIDEAHCISSWGHDFRPEYRQLLSVRERYNEAACFALTATATTRVQRDIGREPIASIRS